MKQLETKVEEFNAALKEMTNQQIQISENAEKTEAEIKETFNLFRNQLDDREKALTAKLSAEAKRTGEELKAKQEALQKYLESSTTALDKENALILDPSMDSKVSY